MYIDPLILIIMTEAIAGLLFLVAIICFLSYRKKSDHRNAALRLIEKLDQDADVRKKKLTDLLIKDNQLEGGTLQNLLGELKEYESKLYQSIIKIFVSQDSQLITGITEQVQSISDVYSRFMVKRPQAETVTLDPSPEMETANTEISRLKLETNLISEQLEMALETMDEVSSEYTKMFDQSKSGEELEESRLKMLETYKNAINKMAPKAETYDIPSP